VPIYFIGDEWLATHCHFPSGILTQVSVHRSWASIGFPDSVPFPTQVPVTTAVLPVVVTFRSLISLASHFADLSRAKASVLLCVELSASVVTKLSASMGATVSASPFFAASVHFCSIEINCCETSDTPPGP
jgi:hypothetical protein